jgi:hypothetical protein
MNFHNPMRRQRGNIIGLLLALLAIGALAYFMLKRGHGENGSGGTDTANAVHCEQRVGQLVSSTGGIGPQAKAQYDALPSECRRFMTDPAALAPSAERAPEAQ